jgi:sulfoxide reductase heme-binding subunit YedZ
MTYWQRRLLRHLLLALIAAAITYIGYIASPPPDFRHRLSMGSAYASLLFLAATLWLGPWNILRRRANPVSFDLRRDLGIWSGILALLHTGVGLTVHLRGRMWMYFFKRLHPLAIQNNQFGAANFVGLASALLFLVLLAISNDLSLRTLGTQRWKSWQRWTYIAAILAVIHGVLFQLVEKRHLPWVLVFASITLTATAIQLVAIARSRRLARKPRYHTTR